MEGMETSSQTTLAGIMEALRAQAERERECGNAAFAAGERESFASAFILSSSRGLDLISNCR